MYYYVSNWLYIFLFYQYPSIHTYIYFVLRPVVALYTKISGTLFWSTFIILHRQNTLSSAQGLPKNVLFMSEFLESIESQRGNSFTYE